MLSVWLAWKVLCTVLFSYALLLVFFKIGQYVHRNWNVFSCTTFIAVRCFGGVCSWIAITLAWLLPIQYFIGDNVLNFTFAGVVFGMGSLLFVFQCISWLFWCIIKMIHLPDPQKCNVAVLVDMPLGHAVLPVYINFIVFVWLWLVQKDMLVFTSCSNLLAMCRQIICVVRIVHMHIFSAKLTARSTFSLSVLFMMIASSLLQSVSAGGLVIKSTCQLLALSWTWQLLQVPYC